MINNVVLVGRLTKDVELKKTASGISYTNFTLAVNRSFKNEQGETEADFINCVVWRNQAENLCKYMRKGSQIGVEGRIQTRSYETEEGMRYITEVVANSITFLENKAEKTDNSFQNEYIETKQAMDDDLLPF